MTHEYAPASDMTLAFFRKDVERSDEQLESIMVSRVVMGEILARIDEAESGQDQVARLTVALGVEREYLTSAEARLAGVKVLAAKYLAHGDVYWPGSVIAEQINYWLDDHNRANDHALMADDQAEILRLRSEVERLTSERAGWVARACNAEIRLCDGCSEPNRCGSACPASPTPTGPEPAKACECRDGYEAWDNRCTRCGYLDAEDIPATPTEPTEETP